MKVTSTYQPLGGATVSEVVLDDPQRTSCAPVAAAVPDDPETPATPTKKRSKRAAKTKDVPPEETGGDA